jgi:hypothetical protein
MVDLLRHGRKISHTRLQIPEDDLTAALVTFSSELDLVFIGSYIFQTSGVQKPLSLPLPQLEAPHHDSFACAFSRCGRFFAVVVQGIIELSLFKIDVQHSTHKRCDISRLIDPTSRFLEFAFHPRRCELVLCSVTLNDGLPKMNMCSLDLEVSPVNVIATLEKAWRDGEFMQGRRILNVSCVNLALT